MADRIIPSGLDLQKILGDAGGKVAILGAKAPAPPAQPAITKRACANCFYNRATPVEPDCYKDPRRPQLVMTPQPMPNGQMAMVPNLHVLPNRQDPAYACSYHVYPAEHRGELVQAWSWDDPVPA